MRRGVGPDMKHKFFQKATIQQHRRRHLASDEYFHATAIQRLLRIRLALNRVERAKKERQRQVIIERRNRLSKAKFEQLQKQAATTNRAQK